MSLGFRRVAARASARPLPRKDFCLAFSFFDSRSSLSRPIVMVMRVPRVSVVIDSRTSRVTVTVVFCRLEDRALEDRYNR